jgi:1,4-dihydroxy-2-naphthoate octaprenyltransferase
MSATATADISRVKAWIMATRPKTLAAAAIPVFVGSALAIHDDVFALLPALAALVGAMLIQIGTNLANDYFDFKKGADTEDRLGPTRVTQAGLISETAVRNAMIATFALSAAVGSYLIVVGGWPIAAIGVASIISGIAYTGGPYPLGYNGLGDVFVFVFFGVIAVTGTYYVQDLTWSLDALLASVPVGLLSVAILVVNNFRDMDQDVLVGKRTLAVRFGRRATIMQYALCLAIPYAIPVVHLVARDASPFVLLPLLTSPLAAKLFRAFTTEAGSALNPVLENTAKLLVAYGVLYSIGIAV